MKILFGYQGDGIFGSILVIGNEPYGEWVRRRKMSGTTVYVDSSVRHETLVGLLTNEDDYAIGSPGDVSGVSLRTAGNGRVTVLRGSAWGFDDCEHSELEIGVLTCLESLQSKGIEFRQTAAGSVAKLIRDMIPSLDRLPARWRPFCHDSIHLGPIVHCRGEADKAIHIDRRGAFLAAMYSEMPHNSWHEVSGISGEHGIGLFDVTVKYDSMIDNIPPLPVRLHGSHTVYPIGKVRGVWTFSVILDALARDEITLDKVRYAIAPARTEKYLAPIADRIQELPKIAAKPMYTRVWGKFASSGFWTGRPNDEIHNRDGLEWTRTSRVLETTVSPLTRPDVASFIVADNYRRVLNDSRKLRPDSIIASHIDAIWTDDIETARGMCGSAVGDWKDEGTGRLRYYRTGTYAHLTERGVRVASMGHAGKKTPDELRRYVLESLGDSPKGLRTWNGDPQTESDAVSSPVVCGDMDFTFQVSKPPPWDNEIWSREGNHAPTETGAGRYGFHSTERESDKPLGQTRLA